MICYKNYAIGKYRLTTTVLICDLMLIANSSFSFDGIYLICNPVTILPENKFPHTKPVSLWHAAAVRIQHNTPGISA
jgi:hypothetical protein